MTLMTLVDPYGTNFNDRHCQLSDSNVAKFVKFGLKNATNVLGSLTLCGPTGGACNTNRICIPEKSHNNVAWASCALE